MDSPPTGYYAKWATPIFVEKTCTNFIRSAKFVKAFSLKIPLYGIIIVYPNAVSSPCRLFQLLKVTRREIKGEVTVNLLTSVRLGGTVHPEGSSLELSLFSWPFPCIHIILEYGSLFNLTSHNVMWSVWAFCSHNVTKHCFIAGLYTHARSPTQSTHLKYILPIWNHTQHLPTSS